MEWLEELLKNAVVADGKLDVEGLMKSITKAFPSHAVPKSDFNALNEEKKKLEADLSARDTQLEELKKSAGGNEELKNQIKQLQDDNKAAKEKLETQLKETKLTAAIKVAVAGSAQDADIVAGLVDRAKLTVGEDGKITGIKEQVKALTESKPFLFKSDSQTQYKPQGGSGGAGKNPFAKETFNLTEQGKLFKENPEQAKAMMAAAGVE